MSTLSTSQQKAMHQAVVKQYLVGEAGPNDVIFIRVDMCIDPADLSIKRERYYTPDKWAEAIQTCEETSYKSWVYLVDVHSDEILLLRKFI